MNENLKALLATLFLKKKNKTMKIGSEAHIRYHQIVFLDYYPESNTFKCGQANTSGGANLNTYFYIPAAIIGIEPLFSYKKLDQLVWNGNVNMWADLWIDDIGYSVIDGEKYDSTGEYLCFPIKKCLKQHSITEAADFEAEPRIVAAEKIYAESQPGEALIGETMTGNNIRGKVIMLYGRASGMTPKFYSELTSEILTNRFSKFYVVLEVDDCYWVNLPLGAIGIKPKR